MRLGVYSYCTYQRSVTDCFRVRCFDRYSEEKRGVFLSSLRRFPNPCDRVLASPIAHLHTNPNKPVTLSLRALISACKARLSQVLEGRRVLILTRLSRASCACKPTQPCVLTRLYLMRRFLLLLLMLCVAGLRLKHVYERRSTAVILRSPFSRPGMYKGLKNKRPGTMVPEDP